MNKIYDNSSKKSADHLKFQFKMYVSWILTLVLFVIIITLIEQFRFIKYGVNLYLKNDYWNNDGKLVIIDFFLFVALNIL